MWKNIENIRCLIENSDIDMETKGKILREIRAAQDSTDLPVSWDQYFMGLAYMAAMKSKDRGAKLGAVIIGDDFNPIATGYNGLAIGLEETHDRLIKPGKLTATACAESNAIFFAARTGRSVKGSTIYTQWCPCNRCAIAVIQSGIRRVVIHKENTHSPSWDNEMSISEDMLLEAGVEFIRWSGDIIQPRIFKRDKWHNE